MRHNPGGWEKVSGTELLLFGPASRTESLTLRASVVSSPWSVCICQWSVAGLSGHERIFRVFLAAPLRAFQDDHGLRGGMSATASRTSRGLDLQELEAPGYEPAPRLGRGRCGFWTGAMVAGIRARRTRGESDAEFVSGIVCVFFLVLTA